MKAEHQQIGTYRIQKPLGGGGMGVVYLAEEQEGGKQYALKLLTATYAPTEQEARRFRREFWTHSRLRHPNIVEVYESGLYKDALFFVMEYVQGDTLNRHFLPPEMPEEDTPERLTYLNTPERVTDILKVTLQICDALAWIHNHGIIHRDLKPENMMIRPDGQVKLLDFGIAKRWGKHEHTQTGSIMGTFTYISPEQAQCAEVDGRADLYSLGVIIYELLAGRPPFVSDEPIGRLYLHLNEQAPRIKEWNPHIPLELETIVLKLLHKDPLDRYQRAEDLKEHILEVMGLLSFSQGDLPSIAKEAPTLRVRDAAFVGREKERQQLMKHIEALRQGEGGLVLLSGQSGIGKTRLAREIVASARIQQIECCTVRCIPESPPYATYQELLEQLRVLLSMRQESTPEQLWGETGQTWFRLMKSQHTSREDDTEYSLDTASVSSTEEEKMLLFESCRMMVEAVLAHEPLLFSIDDLMFADEISLELTEYLVRHLLVSSAPHKLMLLCAYRSEDVTQRHPLSHVLLRLTQERLCSIYDLKPLVAQEVKQMTTSMLGLPPADEALAQLMRQSQGLPFFIEELIKAWDEEEELMEAGDRWYLLANAFTKDDAQISPGRLPATLQKRLMRRIDRLSKPALEVAQHFAVLGQESSFDQLLELCRMPEESFLGCMGELLQLKILTEEWSTGIEKLRFAHAEIQQVLYEQLDARTRRKYHHRAAVMLKEKSSTDGYFELLAHHFLRAEERVQGAWYLLLAGEQQLRALAYHSAMELLNQCQQQMLYAPHEVLFQPNSSWWMRLQQAQLEIMEHTGRYQEGMEQAKALLGHLPEQTERAPLLRWLATFHRHLGEYREALDAIQEVLDASPSDENEELRPYLLQEAGRIYRSQGKHGAALEAFREALAWAISKQLQWEEGRLCCMVGQVLHQRGELKEADAHYTRALELAQESKDQRAEIAAYNSKLSLALDQGETKEAQHCAQEAKAIAERIGDKRGLCSTHTLRGQWYLERRQYEEAQQCLQSGLQLAVELGDLRMEGELMGWLGILSAQQERHAPARIYFEEALDKAMRVGDRVLELQVRSYLTVTDHHQRLRSTDELFEELSRILRITEKMGTFALVLTCRRMLAQLHRLTDQPKAALDELIAARCLANSLGHLRALAHIERERHLIGKMEFPLSTLSDSYQHTPQYSHE